MNNPVDDSILVLASGNPGKIQELQQLLGDTVQVVSAADMNITLPEETEVTFAGNAALKSKAAFEQSGCISVADDSGLEVDALGGRPGVYSARYSGANATDSQNNEKLLDELKNVPKEFRTARFHSAIAISINNDAPFIFEGVCEGTIGFKETGSNGFGYDPLFCISDGRSFAELTSDEKNPISHRGKAMRKAIPVLMELLNRKDQQ